MITLHWHVPPLDSEIQGHLLDAGELAQASDFGFMVSKEGDGVLDLSLELAEISIARRHMDTGPLVPPTVRLTCRKDWFTASLHCTNRQRTARDERIRIKRRAVGS